jgi:hypothetical protein
MNANGKESTRLSVVLANLTSKIKFETAVKSDVVGKSVWIT